MAPRLVGVCVGGGELVRGVTLYLVDNNPLASPRYWRSSWTVGSVGYE